MHRVNIWPGNYVPRYIPKKNKYIHTNIYTGLFITSIIHNSQKVGEISKSPSSDKGIKKIYPYSGILFIYKKG